MARPDTVLSTLNEVIRDSGRLPDSTSYVTTTVDEEGQHANLRMPIVEASTNAVIRNDSRNTDLVGYVTDDAGDRTGFIFHARFDMMASISVYTADGGQYDHKELGYQIRRALYPHDDAGPGMRNSKLLVGPDGEHVEEIRNLIVGDGEPDPDFTMAPTLRRWTIEVDVSFYDEVRTTEDTIRVVHYPEDGQFTAGDSVEIEYDATQYL